MGKGKTAQRAAREAAKFEPPPPPKPKKHAWFKNPAYHQFKIESVTFKCVHCGLDREQHVLTGECQTARRLRLERSCQEGKRWPTLP